MSNNDHRCSQCGSKMVQTGIENNTAVYHCKSCGNNEYVELSQNDHAEYYHRKNMLLGRVRKGIIDWEVTQWDVLRGEIIDFTSAYQEARNDIYFEMAIIACITSGFHILDDKKYRECKQIYKITEKIYKRYMKHPEALPKQMENSGIVEYEEYRQMYKKCKYDYQNKKLVYKVLFTVGKKLVPIPKL